MRRFILFLFISVSCLAQGDITYDDGIGFFVEGGEKQQRLTRPNTDATQRPFLGLSVTQLEASERLALAQQAGVRVSRVVRGSSADIAGIHSEDILLSINGTAISYPEDLVEMIQLYEPGNLIAVDLLREGKQLSVDVRLGSRPLNEEKKWALIWDENRPYLGVDTIDLNPQLAKFFGVDGGLLVSAVHEKTAAQNAGLEAGDILQAWQEEPIQNKADFIRHLKTAAVGQTVKLQVLRHKQVVNLKLTMGSRKGYFFNEQAGQDYYANREYIVLPEALPRGTSMMLEELGNRQEAAGLRAEVEALRAEVDKLRRTLAKMQANLVIKK